MNRYVISGLALAVAVSGGCGSADQAQRLGGDVETVLPVSAVPYTPPSTTVYAPGPATITVIAAPTTTVEPVPGTTSVVQTAPGSTVVSGPGATTVLPPAGATTVVPVPGAVVTTPAPTIPSMLKADDIKTPLVRAHTIYANRIDADQIRGVIHPDSRLKVSDTRGEIKAPEVVASVIYADQITANSVVAEHIYVRDLRRR